MQAQRQWHVPEMMIASMARLIREGEIVFTGVSSNLPQLAVLLARELHARNLVYVSYAGVVDPKPAKASRSPTNPFNLTQGICAYYPMQEIFDLCMRGGLDLLFIGAFQVDPEGGVNLTMIGPWDNPKVRLSGGGGASVMLPTVKRAIVWVTRHDRRVFVEKCDFVTAKGNIDRLVTPLCIFKKEDGQLVLESIHPYSSLQEVKESTAFPLKYTEPVRITPPPTTEELHALNRIDPDRVRDIEFKHRI